MGRGESIDCLTTFCKKDSFPKHKENKISNRNFMLEAEIIKKRYIPTIAAFDLKNTIEYFERMGEKI